MGKFEEILTEYGLKVFYVLSDNQNQQMDDYLKKHILVPAKKKFTLLFGQIGLTVSNPDLFSKKMDYPENFEELIYEYSDLFMLDYSESLGDELYVELVVDEDFFQEKIANKVKEEWKKIVENDREMALKALFSKEKIQKEKVKQLESLFESFSNYEGNREIRINLARRLKNVIEETESKRRD